jgi:hypothetical protein
MPAPIYKTGKAGDLTLAAGRVYFSKWSAKLTKEYADSTDSSGFDATSLQLWKKQAAGGIQLEGSIEGFFDFAATSSAMLGALLSDVAIPAVFKYDQETVYASGLINVMDFDTGVEVAGTTTIGFTCSFKSYGVMAITA